MKELKKIKLNQVVKSEIKNDEMKHILGGACTDYSCSCFSDNEKLSSDMSNLTLDNRSSNGYIP